jgi:photosystem II stability/assembly factor-like uncharacterized protein
MSADGGRTFTDATFSSPAGEVLALTAAPRDPRTLYAVVAPYAPAGLPAATPAPALFVSGDGGATFDARAGSARLHPTAIAIDPAAPSVVWLNDVSPATSAGSSLWLSTDGGVTFGLPPAPVKDAVSALTFSVVPDGPSALLAATPSSGLLRTSDQGKDWTSVPVGADGQVDPVYDVGVEQSRPDVLMALTKTGAWRSTNGGNGFGAVRDGLPADCGATALTRDAVAPSTFLVLCTRGRAYRFQSSGADLVRVHPPAEQFPPDANDPNDPTQQVPDTTQPVPMTELGVRTLPDDEGSSGSLAFDGETLYYAGPPTPVFARMGTTTIHRIRARDGKRLPDLVVPLTVSEIAYDGLRHVLYVQGLVAHDQADMYVLDLRTHAVRHLFALPGYPGAHSQYSFDASLDRFVVAQESTRNVFQLDHAGRIKSRCALDGGQTSGGYNGNDDAGLGQATAMTATGSGGGGYWQAEDDATMYHIGARCERLATYSHRKFAESGAENDALVCDTVTFDRPAVWIRDSGIGKVYAYGIPNGYCPLATKLRLRTPGVVARGTTANVCATLTTRGDTSPLAAMPVTFTVAGRGAGVATTTADGTACVRYRVPGGLPVGTARGAAVATPPVRAAFLGTTSYLASLADGLLRVPLPDVVTHLPLPGIVAPAPPANPPAQPLAQAPIPQAQAQAEAQAQAQAQAQSQAQAQAQSQAQAQAAAVPQVQEQVQLAEQTATGERELNFSRYRPHRARDHGAPLATAAAGLMLAAGFAAQRVYETARADRGWRR